LDNFCRLFPIALVRGHATWDELGAASSSPSPNSPQLNKDQDPLDNTVTNLAREVVDVAINICREVKTLDIRKVGDNQTNPQKDGIRL
jgi:hypothetical protein